MGCISSTDVKNPKKHKQNTNNNNSNNKHIQPALYKSKLDKSTLSKVLSPRNNQQLPSLQKVDYPYQTKRILRMSSTQLLAQYQIAHTLQQCTRLQGPKMLINKVHGGVNILRVYQSELIDEERLKKYHQLLQFQLYIDEEENYLLIDEYCSGPCIAELFVNEKQQQQQLAVDNMRRQQIHNILLQVHGIITKFHKNKMHLGSLDIFSFKKLSHYSPQIKLVQYNVQTKNTTMKQSSIDSSYRMGHAHCDSYEADWQFFGYLLSFFYCWNKSPIFIAHKMQYLEMLVGGDNNNNNNYGKEQQHRQQLKQQQHKCNKLITTLLKGRQITNKQIQQQLFLHLINLTNNNVMNGYRFARDIIKLIMSRRRRVKHNVKYYSKQIVEFYLQGHVKQRWSRDVNNNNGNNNNSNGQQYQQQQQLDQMNNNGYDNNSLTVQQSLSQDNLHKLQMERIFNVISKYLYMVNSQCEQHFTNYSVGVGDNLRKLKQVFIINDPRKKLQQLRDIIAQVR